MTVSTALALVGTGVTLGIFHVLTGPDHLSALATLSANVGVSVQAFLLGLRWGVGHSTGLLLVGMALILLTPNNNSEENEEADDDATVDVPHNLSTFFESLVGVFMLLLGAYGVRRAYDKRQKPKVAAYGSISDDGVDLSAGEEYELDVELQSDNASSTQTITSSCEDTKRFVLSHSSTNDVSEPASFRTPPRTNQNDNDRQIDEVHDDTDPATGVFGRASFCSCCHGVVQRISTGTMAILAGIIHGMAGPGGVLGVIPAVQLHNWLLASIYLGCFCISSTITMGIFATLYGTISSKITGDADDETGTNNNRRQFLIECTSSCLSILVGIIWLVLLSIGKLDDIFP